MISGTAPCAPTYVTALTKNSPLPFFRSPRAQRILAAVGALLLFVGLGVLGYRWAQNDSLATLVEFSGATDRDHNSSQEEWKTALTGDRFWDGDGARTSAHSLAHFRLARRAKLTLKPASQIRFHRRQQKGGAVGLTVEVGEADLRTQDGTITLDSQFGQIVVEPNSLVHLARDGTRMAVNVEVGGLQITGKGGGRRLSSGESLLLDLGGIIVEQPAQNSREPELEAEAKTKEADPDLNLGDGIDHADVVIAAGTTCVVHDPNPPTAVGVSFSEACEGPARLAVGKRTTEGSAQGNLSLKPGYHKYEVRCLSSLDEIASKGTVRVLRDSGIRPLPAFTPTAQVSTDGRRYTVLYQQKLPKVAVTWPNAPSAERYTLTLDGRTLPSSTPSYSLASGSLPPGLHRLSFSANSDPPRASRVTTVDVRYDVQAPAARVAEPANNFAPDKPVKVAGQALPGWEVTLRGKPLTTDGSRRFSAEVSSEGALAVAFSHPRHGIHYYIRRPAQQSSH